MNNSYKITFLIVLFSISILNAQEKLKGNKDVTTEDRNISNFTKIEIIDDLDVKLEYNDSQSVNVEADSNLQSSIITTIYNGTLSIRLQNKIVKKKELTVHINVNNSLKEIYGYNNSKINSKNSLAIDSLTINAFDNSDISLKLNSKWIRINSKKTSDLKFDILSDLIFIESEESSVVKGTIDAKETKITTLDRSTIDIKGSTNNLTIETLGNSKFKGDNFDAKHALVNTSNSSDAYVNSSKTIDIYAKNDSKVYIYANPKINIIEFFDKASIHKK